MRHQADVRLERLDRPCLVLRRHLVPARARTSARLGLDELALGVVLGDTPEAGQAAEHGVRERLDQVADRTPLVGARALVEAGVELAREPHALLEVARAVALGDAARRPLRRARRLDPAHASVEVLRMTLRRC